MGTRPELLAHHYTQAGLAERAIPYWQRANQRTANVEAITYLTKGIELVQTLPDTPERAQLELPLQTTLGGPLIALKGFAAPEVGVVYTRARELCCQAGETQQIFPVLWGMCAFYSVRAEWQTAHTLAEQLLTLAERVQDDALLIEAHYAMGQAYYQEGEFSQGREHFEQLLTLYDPAQHHALAFVYGMDPGVMGKAVLACTLVFLGYPDQARQMSQAALALAEEVAHPNSLAYGLAVAGWNLCRGRAVRAAQELAERLITLATAQGYAAHLAYGRMLHGWTLATQGHRTEGIAQFRAALDASRATASVSNRPLFLSLLTALLGDDGHVEEGLTLLAKAQTAITSTGERYCEAGVFRIQGELTLQARDVAAGEKEAEACYQQALEVAHHQQSKYWELRAATSLARLWQQQGKTTEAHELLAPVYNWFTKGFDTADLKDAKALLEEIQ